MDADAGQILVVWLVERIVHILERQELDIMSVGAIQTAHGKLSKADGIGLDINSIFWTNKKVYTPPPTQFQQTPVVHM